jgi:hypothetical protein
MGYYDIMLTPYASGSCNFVQQWGNKQNTNLTKKGQKDYYHQRRQKSPLGTRYVLT